MDKNVWVVDDDESIRWVLEKGLSDGGMDVQTFDSANKVIKKLETENPHLEKRISSPNIVSNVGSRTDFGKSGGFNEVLSKVADKHPRSELAKTHRRRSAKEVKTDEVIKKHVDIQKRKGIIK